MAVFTERQAIQQRMAEIREERRELGNEYYTLMDRLRELGNVEKEAIDTESVVGNLTEAIKTLQQLIPHIPAEALIRQVAEVVKENDITIEIDKEEQKPQVAPEHVIKHQQYLDSEKNLTERKRKRYNGKELNQLIIDIMKETGVPMKLGDIRAMVEETTGQEFNEGTFHNRMNNLMLSNPKVTKPMRGYYQYQM